MPNNKPKKRGRSITRHPLQAAKTISYIATLIGMYFSSTPVWAAAPQLLAMSDFSKMSLEDLGNIEITSVSRQPERILDAPAAITVITSEDIRRSGATSIPEALRLADNLSVAQKNAHDWAISARGFNTELGNKLLVMIDGRTIYSPLYSGVLWDRQDYLLADIDRIEVISGPGSTLWGANAVNGVINIITKKSSETQGTYVEALMGDELRSGAAVRYGGKSGDNTTYRVYGKFTEKDSQATNNSNDANDAWHIGQVGFRIDTQANNRDSFTFQGDIYGSREDVTSGGTGDESGGNILGRWTRRFSADSDINLQMYYDRTNLEAPQPASVFFGVPLAPAGTFRDKLDTFDIDFQHRFSLNDRNNIVWGLGYRYTHDNVDPSPSLTFVPNNLDRRLYSGFLQDEIKLNEKLALTVGSKLEHNDYTGWEVEPSARLQWKPSQNQLVWGAVSRAVRMPSRIDSDVRFTTPLLAPLLQNLLSGSSSFKSETVVAYELGYRTQINKVSTSITAFYNEYDDIRSIGRLPTFPLPSFIIENNLAGQTYGIEFSGSYQALDWWRLNLGYRYLEENIHVKSGEFDLNNGGLETADPRHQVSLRSSMNLAQNVELDAQLRWVDKLKSAAVSVPSYTELNLRLGWRPVKNIEVSLVGQNLLHDQHAEYGVAGPNQIDIERGVFGKVRWEF